MRWRVAVSFEVKFVDVEVLDGVDGVFGVMDGLDTLDVVLIGGEKLDALGGFLDGYLDDRDKNG